MIVHSSFRPMMGFSNAHVQTLLPFLLKKTICKKGIRQTLELDDGDFLDLSWYGKPENGKPIAVLFHGLEGSTNSHYVKTIMRSFQEQGWTGLLMHFRGCSHRLNRLPRFYHSGETGDARHLLEWLKNNYPESPLSAVGVSLGGNMLLKLQAEYGENSPLKASVSICAPVQLASCAKRLDDGVSKIYQRHLIRRLNKKLYKKSNLIDYEKLIGLNKQDIKNIKTFWQFDDKVTAPLHGFKDVHDYYDKSSARQYLKDIRKPTLMIHALDDPFMLQNSVPSESELSESIDLELCDHGGHIGFISGSLYHPKFWLQQRIPEYIKIFIET